MPVDMDELDRAAPADHQIAYDIERAVVIFDAPP